MKSSNEYKKMHKVVNDLSEEETKLVEIVSNQMAVEKIDSIQGAIDIAMCAKLIEIIPELSLKEIYSINEEVGNMSAEILIKENQLMKSVKGDSKMAKKISENLKNKVRKESEKLIKAKLSQNKAIEELKKKFSDLPKSLITVTYKEVKEELKVEEEVEKGAEKIMDIIDHEEIKEEVSKELSTDLENKIKETAKIAAKNIEEMIEDSEEIIPEETKEVNKFKPILMKFEGEFATYTKSKDKLVIENDGKVEISSLDVIEEMRKTEITGLEQQIQIAKAKYAEFKEAFEV